MSALTLDQTIPGYSHIREKTIETINWSPATRFTCAILGAHDPVLITTLLATYQNIRMTIIDTDPTRLDQLPASVTDSERVVIDTPTSLSLPDQRYDVVMLIFSLHQVPADTQESLLATVYDHLYPRGLCVISDLCKAEEFNLQMKTNAILMRFREHHLSTTGKQTFYQNVVDHEHFFVTPHDIDAHLRTTGFRYVDMLWTEHFYTLFRAVK